MLDFKIFLIHLRLPYMFGILSAPYLISAVFATQTDWNSFFIQFLIVHALLFGGATAFNSFWDKDEGPVGGLKNPPKMKEWMRFISIALMFSGFLFNFDKPLLFNVLYLFSLILFWVYSSPIGRWKGRPILSLFVIGLSTGANSFLMGLISLGTPLEWQHFLTSIGVGCMLTAMYPISQIFQIEEDTKRGDKTFAIKYGFNGIKRLFMSLNTVGVLFITIGLLFVNSYLALGFLLFSIIPTLQVWRTLITLKGIESEYEGVMRLKYTMSFSFVGISIFVILIRYVDLFWF